MSDSRKNVMLAVAGVGLVIGAALLFHWASTATEEEDNSVDIHEELKAQGLTQVKRQGQMLDP